MNFLLLLQLLKDPRVLTTKGPLVEALTTAAGDDPAKKLAADFLINALDENATAERVAGNLAKALSEGIQLIATQKGPAEFHRGAHGG